MKKFVLFLSWLVLFSSPVFSAGKAADLSSRIKNNPSIAYTKSRAVEIIKTGFNAGDGYREVWIRDYNTFIELAATVYPKAELKENLLVFFRMQGADGNIIDGFVPRDKADVGYKFIYSDLEPRYAGHKNTVETDQETSLIQTVYKYIHSTGDRSIMHEKVGGRTVAARMEMAMDFLMKERFSEKYGLIWGATTADWGDVQPEHEWGVEIDENTHYAIDIYDNAMFLVALGNLTELLPETRIKWEAVRKEIAANCRTHLWDEKNKKFIPHIYLDGSPFPAGFNENEIFYHGGTAVAIEAGLLSKDEIRISLGKMIANVKASGAATIGLTLYPPYPEGFFKNKAMYPYGYQNGGDWTWFGGRMILQLIKNGFLEEAYEQLCPMTDRVMKNNGFYEWYSVNNEPKGSGTFRGEAGVLFVAIEALEKAAQSKSK
ncbi:MAG: hypothetical protein AAGU19_17465 [Prolixibacteraceae bacterium]